MKVIHSLYAVLEVMQGSQGLARSPSTGLGKLEEAHQGGGGHGHALLLRQEVVEEDQDQAPRQAPRQPLQPVAIAMVNLVTESQ